MPASTHSSASPTLVLTPLRPAVPATGGVLEVLVRVQAPPPPEREGSVRQPLRLALVIDRSGSMDGHPLEQAVLCAAHIIERLQPQDEVAVVLYDDHVTVPVPLQSAKDKHGILARLQRVESGGSTALFDGWEAGARQLEAGSAGSISRVILLSDGQANHGLVDPAEIARHCAAWLAKGITTTTVGLGRSFNEDLMIAMARAGGGQQYYGQTAEDLYDGFAEELELLQSLYLRRLRVRPIAGEGVIVEPASEQQPLQGGWLRMSDLAWASESWLLLRLHVSPHAPTGGVPRALLGCAWEAVNADGNDVSGTGPMLALPVVSAEAFAALPQDDLVHRRVLEMRFADQSLKARTLLQQGKKPQAHKLLSALEAEVANHPWLLEKVAYLQQLSADDAMLAAKEMSYSSRRVASRLASVQEASYSGDETSADSAPAFLRRKSSEGRGRKA